MGMLPKTSNLHTATPTQAPYDAGSLVSEGSEGLAHALGIFCCMMAPHQLSVARSRWNLQEGGLSAVTAVPIHDHFSTGAIEWWKKALPLIYARTCAAE